MKSADTYLNFNGNCAEAFEFYRTVFGGDFTSQMKYSDMPSEAPKGAEQSKRLMHIALPISKTSRLMGCDIPENFGEMSGNNFHIYLDTENKTEADKLFTALSAGGKVSMPMATTFWGSYFGMVTDKFGIQWMIGFETNPQ